MTALPDDIAPLAHALTGQYEIERELGRGGMGIVYLARDVKLERDVAIKVLPPTLADSPDVRERFVREARVSARLAHPNIVTIYRADEIDARVFFVMAYIAGESLAERLRANGPLTPAQAVPVIRDVALALAYAHERGVVHRDVKPENILLDATSGRAMVTDFGIARLAEAAPLTMSGQILGSVNYMSPEQVSGDLVDGRSDLYSLGVVAFQALSGRLPFENESASAVIVAHVTKAAPPLLSVAPSVPAPLASVIDACLAKAPSARYPTGMALARALDEAWDGGRRGGVFSPPLLSEQQAKAVWQRAADLQAATASHPAPAVDALRIEAVPASLTSGIAMDRVRDSAVEAGISREHVERAAQELGLARGASRTSARTDVALTAPVRRPILTPLFAAPFRIHEEVEVDGEISQFDYDAIVDVIRRDMGDEGQVGGFGRTLTWSTRPQARKGRIVSITIVPRNGRTRIRIDERLGSIAGGLYGGLVGGMSPALASPLVVHFAQGAHPVIGGIAAGTAFMLTTFSIARTIIGTVKRSRVKQLRELRLDIEAEVRAAIEAQTPR